MMAFRFGQPRSWFWGGLLMLLAPATANAFYETSSDALRFELRGNVRISNAFTVLPEIEGYTYGRHANMAAGLFRLMADAEAGEHIAFESHLVQEFVGSSAALIFFGGDQSIATSEDQRTPILSHDWYDRGGTTAALSVDRLVIKGNWPRLQLSVGRQPVNLATTYFFVPNDFFQPFSAQTFFRVYKPGVDAARMEVELGTLTQLSLIGVLGYKRDASDPGRFDEIPSLERSSLLGRAAAVFFDFEWAVLGGRVAGHTVLGGALQGELFEVVGIRGEGHYVLAEDGQSGRAEVAIGAEKRFESSLFLRVEQFYHGGGVPDRSRYAASLLSGRSLIESPYLARHYTAVAASYELSALSTGDVMVLFNWVDHSFLVACYLAYSLADEAEAAFSVSVPVGTAPSLVEGMRSELGASPLSASFEVRVYF